ncbi:BrnT family toxin [Cereibacter sphaeroides]|uniref:BrnT family toxin n=1 Tax=Cereibacter sphaeroides TaxID=1063 RepID=UPI000B77AED7|nr:BrnT family toxin [Cereibacter sphaeroides]
MLVAMESRFDPAKDAANLQKHKLPLIFGDRVFEDDSHLIIPSIRAEDQEERFKVVGEVEGKLFTAVFTWRGDLPRFISVRRSNNGEERAYRSSC